MEKLRQIEKMVFSLLMSVCMVLPSFSGIVSASDINDENRNESYLKYDFISNEELEKYLSDNKIESDKDGFYTVSYSDSMPDGLKAEYKNTNDVGFYTKSDNPNGVYRIGKGSFILSQTDIKAKHIVLGENIKYVNSKKLDTNRIKYLNSLLSYDMDLYGNKMIYQDPNSDYVSEDFIYNERGNEILGFSDSGKTKFENLKTLSFPKLSDIGVVIDTIGDSAFSSIGLESVNLGDIKNVGKDAFSKNKIKDLDLNGVNNINKDAFKDNNIKNLDLTDAKKVEDNAFVGNDVKKVESKKEINPKAFDKNVDVDKKLGPAQAGVDGAKAKPERTSTTKPPRKFGGVDIKNGDLRKLKLVEPERLSKSEFSNLIESKELPSRLSGKKKEGLFDWLFAKSEASEIVTDRDGSKIETNTVNWIVEDGTRPDRLKQVWSDDYEKYVRAKINFALSGHHDYDVGEIQIKVPKRIFRDRSGKLIGTTTMAVPEMPDKSQTFAYVDDGDQYVLVNTRKLPAATQGFFEMTFRGLTPHMIKDLSTGYVSDKYFSTIEVTTHKGNKLYSVSNKIDAEVDTKAVISSAVKRGNAVYEFYPKSFPSNLRPDNTDDYIFASWTTYAKTDANQTYKVDVKDMANQGGFSNGAKMLGYKVHQTSDVKKLDGNNSEYSGEIYKGYGPSNSDSYYMTFYVAYPKSNFHGQASYEIKNKVEYTLTSDDDKQVTKTSDVASLEYTPIKFEKPHGHFIVKKYGNNKYSYALNKLRKGQDVSINYSMTTEAFGLSWTKGDGLDEDIRNYGKNSYKTITRDYNIYANDLNNLSSDDYNLSSIVVNTPDVYTYGKYSEDGYGYFEGSNVVSSGFISEGRYGYIRDTDAKNIPDVHVYGKTKDGSFIKYGVVSFKNGYKISVENGASLKGRYLTFPEGIVEYKLECESKMAAVIYSHSVNVKIKPSAKIKDKAEYLFKNSDTPMMTAVNEVDMNVVTKSGNMFINKDTASDVLSGFAYGSKLDKSLSYSNDTSNRRVKLHYTGTMTSQTNLDNKADLEEVKETGLYKDETACTWYDLLPKGVIPNTRSIKVRSGDKVKDVDLIEDYRGSGRTLMIVKVDLKSKVKYHSESSSFIGAAGIYDDPTIEFDASYTWESLSDFGKKLTNHIVYESTNTKLGSIKGFIAEPDDPLAGNHRYSRGAVLGSENLLKDLNKDNNNESYLYASTSDDLVVDTWAITSLKKVVDVNDENKYGDGLLNELPKNVYENGKYSYRLRIKNTDMLESKNIILYDKLDGYKPTEDKDDFNDKQWRGIFDKIDLTQLKNKGINPVVYYSTKKDIVLDNALNRKDNNLSDTNVWTKTLPNDKSTITAVAIDCRYSNDGKEFVLGVNKSIAAFIHMKAPIVKDFDKANQELWYDRSLGLNEKEAGLTGGGHAYNNAVSILTSISKADGSVIDNLLIRDDYTKVGLKPYKLKIEKKFDDDDNRDGIRSNAVDIDLLADGRVVDTVHLEGNKWSHDFGNQLYLNANSKPIKYTFAERGADGYTLTYEAKYLADGVSYLLTNKHDPAKVKINGVKTWDNGEKPESVTVKLLADGVEIKSITTDKSKDWKYDFGELFKYNRGKVIKYEIKEDYVEGYRPEYKGYNIFNERYPYGDLKLSKEVVDVTDQSKDKEFTFVLTIKNEDNSIDVDSYDWERSDGKTGKVSSGGELKLKGGQNIVVKKIKSKNTYELVENKLAGFTAENDKANGVIKSGLTSYANFKNKYDTNGECNLSIKKVLNGRKLKSYQFLFDLYDESGKVVKSGFSTSDGKVIMGALKYKLKDANKVFNYTLKERIPKEKAKGYEYDEHVENIKVTTLDNGDGTMTVTPSYDNDGAVFTNTYKAKGELKLTANKMIKNGFKMKDGDFKFGLKRVDNKSNSLLDVNELDVSKGSVDKNGLITFDPIKFTEADVGKTFIYEAYEITGSDNKMIYDDSKIRYTVTVFDNGDGTLSFDAKAEDLKTDDVKNDTSNPLFVNQFKDGALKVEKYVEGARNAEFTFDIEFTGDKGSVPDGIFNISKTKPAGIVDFVFGKVDGVLLDPIPSNPKAGEYTFVLPNVNESGGTIWTIDGIKTDFNSGSKLTYKVDDKGSVTKIEIDGHEIPMDKVKDGVLKFDEMPCPNHKVEFVKRPKQPFLGEVAGKDFITYEKVSNDLGVTNGQLVTKERDDIDSNNKNSVDQWLHYNYEGKNMYISKLPVRTHIDWNSLYSAGVVFGDDVLKKPGGDNINVENSGKYTPHAPITIGGKQYRARLLKALNTPDKKEWKIHNPYIVNVNKNSEWNKLILPIVTRGKEYSQWGDYYDDIEDPSTVPEWTNPATGKQYSWDNLCFNRSSKIGTYNWCQEVAENSSYRALRGYSSGVAYGGSDDYGGVNGTRAWRLVLEEVANEKKSQLFLGEVDGKDFITYEKVSNDLGVTKGQLVTKERSYIDPNNKTSVDQWLHYNYEGKNMYISKLPVRTHIDWNSLYKAGVVFGDDVLKKPGGDNINVEHSGKYTPHSPITIGGKQYRARLLKALNTPDKKEWEIHKPYNGNVNKNSEWNKLILPIVTRGKNNDQWGNYYDNIEDPSTVPEWTNPATGKQYTWNNLCFNRDSETGTLNWCQEVAESSSYRACRGYNNGAAYGYSLNYGYDGKSYAWRLVLEEIPANETGIRFYGIMPSSCLITYKKLLNDLGLNNLAVNPVDAGWLHFTDYEKELYMAKKSVTKDSLEFNQIKNLVDGNKIFELNGDKYKLRLIDTEEWDRLVLSVVKKDDDNKYWGKTDGIDPNIGGLGDYSWNDLAGGPTFTSDGKTRGKNGAATSGSESKAYFVPILEKIPKKPQPFLGEVDGKDFITYEKVSNDLGVTKGQLVTKERSDIDPNNKNSVDQWLHYNYEGKNMYISKLPVRTHIDWNSLYKAGVVFGDDVLKKPGGDNINVEYSGKYTPHSPITIGGKKYRARLLKALNTPDKKEWEIHDPYNGDVNKNSEWNKLILPIVTRGKQYSEWGNYYENIEDPSTVPEWINPLTGKQYSWDELCVKRNDDIGTYNWCQEVAESSSYRAFRGNYYGAAYGGSDRCHNDNDYRAWRLVLEQVD